MPVRQRTPPKSAVSRKFDDFCKAIHDNGPGVSLVEFRHRAGTHGRYAPTPFDYPVSDEERADPQTLIERVFAALEGFDDEIGPGLSFEATVQVTAGGETKALGPFRFQLVEDDGDDAGDLLKSRFESALRTNERMEKMLHRAWDRNESILERAGELLGPAVELERVKAEHKQRMREYDVEENEDRELFGLLRSVGPTWLVTQAAKKEREKGFPDGEQREIWKRLRTVAALVVERDDVRGVLGEKCTDIVRELGKVQTEAEAQQLLTALQQIQKDTGQPNLMALIKVAPELLPFADLLATS